MSRYPSQAEFVLRVAEVAVAPVVPRAKPFDVGLALVALFLLALTVATAWSETASRARREEELSRLRSEFAFAAKPTQAAALPAENPLVPDPRDWRSVPRSVFARLTSFGPVNPAATVPMKEVAPADDSFADEESDARRESRRSSCATLLLINAVSILLAASLIPGKPSLFPFIQKLACTALTLGAASAAIAAQGRPDLLVIVGGLSVSVLAFFVLMADDDGGATVAEVTARPLAPAASRSEGAVACGAGADMRAVERVKSRPRSKIGAWGPSWAR